MLRIFTHVPIVTTIKYSLSNNKTLFVTNNDITMMSSYSATIQKMTEMLDKYNEMYACNNCHHNKI